MTSGEYGYLKAESESLPDSELLYTSGWKEILEAPDAADYQLMLAGLTEMTQRAMLDTGVDHASGQRAVLVAWQKAIELIAGIAVDPDDELTEAEMVETALRTLEMNLTAGGMGWDEEGLVFTIASLITGEEATIDLRDFLKS
jgi:hypothetical protein